MRYAAQRSCRLEGPLEYSGDSRHYLPTPLVARPQRHSIGCRCQHLGQHAHGYKMDGSQTRILLLLEWSRVTFC